MNRKSNPAVGKLLMTSTEEHKKERIKRLSPWFEALLPITGTILFNEELFPLYEKVFASANSSVKYIPDFDDVSNPGDVFCFDFPAMDVEDGSGISKPYFFCTFRYSGIASIVLCTDEDVEFLDEFYSKKLKVELKEEGL